MKFTKIICIFFAVLFIVTAANNAVARQETRSLKIKDIFKSGFLKSECKLDGERPLASIISRILDLFRFPSIERNKIPDKPGEVPEEEDPKEEEPIEEKGVVRGNVSVVLEDSAVFLSDACVDFYLTSDLNNAVYTARSADDGSYCISDVDEGFYIVTASKEGYKSKTCEVNVDSGIVEFVNFVLNKEISISLDFSIQNIQVDEQIYGNSVSVDFVLRNNGEESVTLNSLELGGSVYVKITRPDSEILWYGALKDSGSSSSRGLSPGETHNKVIEIKDENGDLSSRGIYIIKGFYKSTEELDIELSTAESQFEIKTDKNAVDSINDFSLKLFKDFLPGEDLQTDEPYIIRAAVETSFSPMLLLLSLHMLQQGAAGDTYDEITDVLGIDGKDENILNNIKNIYNQYFNPQNTTDEISINNAIWFDKSQTDIISQNYLDTLKEEYNYDVRCDNLIRYPKSINTFFDWVRATTNDMLPKTLPQRFFWYWEGHPYTTSSFYLDSEWEKPFGSTVSKNFYYEDGEGFVTDIPFMTGIFKNLNYKETEDLQVLDLACNGDISMLMMLPKQGYKIEDIAKYMNKETLAEWQKSFSTNTWGDSTFDISIPKTQLKRFAGDAKRKESGIPSEAIIREDMTENLKDMGMTQAFSKDYADFSKIISSTSEDDNIYLKNVYQDTFIKINEKGIEAAASTYIFPISRDTYTLPDHDHLLDSDYESLKDTIPFSYDNEDGTSFAGNLDKNMEKQDSPDTIVFDADRPFSFIIHDKKGTILYMGTVFGQLIIISPLTLDIKNDGIKTSELSDDSVLFDLNNDGKKDLTGWIAGKDDAFLALDLNHNGIIDNGGELFGDNTLLPDGEKASNGFEALTQYDTNKDLKIDQTDQVWSGLLLWIDANHNAVSEQEELTLIKDSKVEEIYLKYSYLNKLDHGNLLRECSSFKNKDGTVGSIIDVWFKVIT